MPSVILRNWIFPEWTIACCLSNEAEINALSQYSHLNGFSTLWTLQRCLIRSRFFKNDSVHSKHLCGFSPRWTTFTWVLSKCRSLLSNSHNSHLCGSISVTWWQVIFGEYDPFLISSRSSWMMFLNMIYQFTSFVCFIITVAAFEFFVTVTFSMSFQIVQLICRKGTLITSVSWSKVLVRCNQMSIQLRFIFKDAFAKFTAL